MTDERPGEPSRRAVLGALGALGLVGVPGRAAATADETPAPGSAEVRWSLDVGGLRLATALLEDLLVTEEGAGSPLKARDVRTGEVTWSGFPNALDFHYDEGLFGV
ncbi:hypothetical protein BRC81_08005 [Halobacteriales archaeon QS_1_68_20]|nr:MAG: hypothetical protein BRC81_08005 [Halobacteriales archaeon QS_1_68_20]